MRYQGALGIESRAEEPDALSTSRTRMKLCERTRCKIRLPLTRKFADELTMLTSSGFSQEIAGISIFYEYHQRNKI